MLTLAVLFGGRGSEREISRLSAKTLLSHIPKDRFSVLPIGIDLFGNFWLYDGDVSEIADEIGDDAVPKKQVFPIRMNGRGVFHAQDGDYDADVILPILHGDFGEDGKLQGLFETVGIPYVGADTLGGALGFDKVVTKRIAASLGIPVVPWTSVWKEDDRESVKNEIRRAFGRHPFPLFVKPSALGSSIGTFRVRSFSELFSAVDRAGEFGEVLIERYVAKKREIEIAFLDGALPLFSKAGEIRVSRGYYDYRKKYETPSAKIGLSDLDETLAERLYRYVKTLLRPLHVRDLCRFDFFVTKDGKIFFNEINTMPGMTDVSLYPKLLADAGVPFEMLIERWVRMALDRRV